jgi:hypothetical protein
MPAYLPFLVLIASSLSLAVGLIAFLSRQKRDKGRWGLNLRRSYACEACGQAVPSVRMPTSWRQAMWGGVTCPNCKTELDKWCRPIAD